VLVQGPLQSQNRCFGETRIEALQKQFVFSIRVQMKHERSV
jgi:hypothetical protein